MRFTAGPSLTQVVKYTSQRLVRTMTVPVTNGYRKARRIFNPNGLSTKVVSDIRKGGKDMMAGTPQSLADYFSVGSYYVAKKLVFLAAVLVFVAPALYLKFVHPMIRSNFLTVPMVVNSAEMVGYTGRVELLSEKNGTVLYHGPLSAGRVTGEGILYDYDGNLIYQGGFLMEQYEGVGQSYWPSGKLCYAGTFSANRYEGQGTLYARDGTLLYEGGFSGGLYSGEGTLYQNGTVLYRGSFKDGKPEGEGRLYSGRRVIYEGGFAGGTFEGQGKEYDPVAGRLLYEGSFSAGRYEGEGRQYDASTGALVYEGGFAQGVREGDGALYDKDTRWPLYKGGFRAGRYDGQGEEYDAARGAVIYRGAFLLGAYHGAGTQYDPATGFVTAAGEYRGGKLAGAGTGEPAAPDTANGGNEQPGASGNEAPVGPDTPGGTAEAPVTPGTSGNGAQPGSQGKQVYTGPVTASGGIDYAALAAMTPDQVEQQFRTSPSAWSLADGGVKIYEDRTENVGVSLRTDGSGKLVSLDVWNDAPVAGIRAGMSAGEITAVLGAPQGSVKETMGDGRMISISQSNRYFGRLTNLSPESQVKVSTYKTASGTVRAIFDGTADQCLLLEILP